jgi:hypothetical protein
MKSPKAIGASPTGTVATTVFVPVSMTETLPLSRHDARAQRRRVIVADHAPAGARMTSPRIVAVLQSNYIPWKGYFDLIHDVDLFIFRDDVQYTKGDWRNRNRIKTGTGPRWLTIPVGTDGVIAPDVRHRYPLAAAADAHRDLEALRTTGQIVLLA